MISANAFGFDKTPYEKQKPSTLELQFDALVVAGEKLPLRVYVRAMADPLTTWDAQKPQATDMVHVLNENPEIAATPNGFTVCSAAAPENNPARRAK